MDDRFLFAFLDRSVQEQEDENETEKTNCRPADGGHNGMLHSAGECTGRGKFKSECGGLMRTPPAAHSRLRLY